MPVGKTLLIDLGGISAESRLIDEFDGEKRRVGVAFSVSPLPSGSEGTLTVCWFGGKCTQYQFTPHSEEVQIAVECGDGCLWEASGVEIDAPGEPESGIRSIAVEVRFNAGGTDVPLLSASYTLGQPELSVKIENGKAYASVVKPGWLLRKPKLCINPPWCPSECAEGWSASFKYCSDEVPVASVWYGDALAGCGGGGRCKRLDSGKVYNGACSVLLCDPPQQLLDALKFWDLEDALCRGDPSALLRAEEAGVKEALLSACGSQTFWEFAQRLASYFSTYAVAPLSEGVCLGSLATAGGSDPPCGETTCLGVCSGADILPLILIGLGGALLLISLRESGNDQIR